MAMACMILAPTYRIYMAERFSFPVWLAFVVYVVLNIIVSVPHNIKLLVWMGAGGLAGAVYMILLKNGWAIGKGVYNIKSIILGSKGKRDLDTSHPSVSRQLTNKKNEEIDAILDKIHQKGLLSLTS